MSADGKSRPARGQVILWTMPVNNVDPDAKAAMRAVLSDEERARADRLKSECDNTLFVAAHALARTMLAAHGAPNPHFRTNPWGKPEIDAVGNTLRFNLTHTRGLAACAVTEVDNLGIDAEAADRSIDATRLARRFFAPQEAAFLAGLAAEERPAAFRRLWTLKEAFIKAVGQGLSMPLDAFAFTLDPIGFNCGPAIDPVPAQWHFESIIPDDIYIVAVALHRPHGGSMTVHHETIAPAELPFRS
jgi:4'-phosphopantetheinyl transferase